MLQWFNKQSKIFRLEKEEQPHELKIRKGTRSDAKPASTSSTLSSSSPKMLDNQQHSDLADDDYEFLFNQLLDGVAHGWHLGKIVKFFNKLESLSTPSQWLNWLEKFEQKIVYGADLPSQKRIGAIMMRFGELTQSNFELAQFGKACHHIGQKLFLGNTTELIWEYNGQDRVVQKDNSSQVTPLNHQKPESLREKESQESVAESAESNSPIFKESLTNPTKAIPFPVTLESPKKLEENPIIHKELFSNSSATRLYDTPEADSIELEDFLSNSFNAQSYDILESDQFTKLDEDAPSQSQGEVSLPPQPTQSSDLFSEPKPERANSETKLINSIESLEALTEQLTVLQDAPSDPEIPKTRQTNQKPDTVFTQQPTQSPDFVPETKPETNNSLESLEALTEQLTVLQDITSETDTKIELDSESTLIAPETTQPAGLTSLSVASFLEATKALIPQQKKPNITPLTWEEFIAVLEQDPTLAHQVAQYLQITSTDPQEIIQAAVNRITQQEATKFSPATIELIESWFNLGLKQASAEDFQGAIASWDKALKLNPHLSEAWHNRGSALGRLGKYEEAIHSFNRAINLAPDRYQAWNDRAHALYQVHKWEQAVASWDKAISIMSDNYQFWYNRGCALEQLQRYDESISSYQKALEIKPDFQPARTRYINLLTENSSSSSN